MNLNAIRLFLRIIRRGSLVAAAQELNLSASTASRLLSGLERETGLKLFSRDGQKLRPTREGKQYFNECHRVLVAVDDLPRIARRLTSGAPARLRVVSTPRFVSSLVFPATERFLKSNPDVEIDLQNMVWHEVAHLSSERSFDVGLTAVPINNPSLETEQLMGIPVSACMRRGHKLAQRPYVRALELKSERLIGISSGSFIREAAEDAFAADGIVFLPHITVPTGDMACEFALRMNAVAITDPLISWASKDYALVPIKPLRMMQIGIVQPALQDESRLVSAFKACLREEAKRIEQKLHQQLRSAEAQHSRRARQQAHRP